MLSIVSLFFSCTGPRQVSSNSNLPLITTDKKTVIGAYCEVAIPPEEVKITIKTDAKSGKAVSDEGDVYYFFLAHISKHPAIPFPFTSTDEWYLVISKDPKTQTDLKKMTPMQTGLLAVAEIPPLTEFYQALILQLPESMKSRLQALNLYKIYQCFGYVVVDKVDQHQRQNQSNSVSPTEPSRSKFAVPK
jgi:hypothetical protein